MSNPRLPVGTVGEIVEFDPRMSSPIVRRGLDRLAEIMSMPHKPIHLWSYWCFGAKSSTGPLKRPRTEPVRTENIPRELATRPQWVCWDWAWDGTRWGKPPLSPITGSSASEWDPRTWSSFDTACEFAARHSLSGIGFVLSEDDPFVGVDIDRCRDPETGVLQPWAEALVADLDSYTEVSPSGSGLHVLIQGSLSEERHYGLYVRPEVYDRNRFLAFTGHHIAGTPRIIGRRQHELRNLRRLPSDTGSDPGPYVEVDEASLRALYFLNDMVVVSCWDGNVHALDVNTGTERWQFPATGSRYRPPLITGAHGVVYVGNTLGELHAYDALTGSPRWTFRADDEEGVEDVWASDRIVCVQSWNYDDSIDENVTILDASTGIPIRRFDRAGSWIVRHHILFIRDAGGILRALDPETGEDLWHAAIGSGRFFGLADTTVGNGTLGLSGSTIFAADVATGRVRWRRVLSNACSGFVVHPDSRTAVYTEVGKDGLSALDVMTGEDFWRFSEATLLYIRTVTPMSVFAAVEDGIAIVALDIASGRERWRFHIPLVICRQHERAADELFGSLKSVDTSIQPEIVIDGRVYIASRCNDDELISVVEEANGTLLWEAEGHLLRVEDALVYAGTQNGQLVALDARTGAERWRVTLPGRLDNDDRINGSFLWKLTYSDWIYNYPVEASSDQSLYLGRLQYFNIRQDHLYIATEHAMHAFRLG